MLTNDQLRDLAAEACAIQARVDAASVEAREESRLDLMHAGAHLDQAITAIYRAAGVDVAALDAQAWERVQ